MYDRRVNKKGVIGEKQGVKTREMIHSFFFFGSLSAQESEWVHC